ncbi:thioredoxin family protein [Actinoplanes sp. NPDC024001]|uniref:thioredoxin family protein n=1 Tax=Actinoplanes sp. NPDC024001 TaxID=3154598 RepID=UPI0033F7D341
MRLTVGEQAPGFTLPDTDGTPVPLRPAEHPATVVVFTANACPYARAWHDRIQAVARDYAERGVTVLQIVSNDECSAPQDTAEAMAARVHAGELAGPFLRDATQAVARAYGATATPEVFVIDRAGTIRYHGAPDGDYDDPGQDARFVRQALDAVLAGGEVARPVTSPAGCSIKWRVELLWWAGCPSHDRAAAMLREVLTDAGRTEVQVVEREIHTPVDGFPGSPTFHVGGADLYPDGGPPALGCRVYTRPDGRFSPLPDRDDLAARLREALARPWDLPHWVDHRKERKTA